MNYLLSVQVYQFILFSAFFYCAQFIKLLKNTLNIRYYHVFAMHLGITVNVDSALTLTPSSFCLIQKEQRRRGAEGRRAGGPA